MSSTTFLNTNNKEAENCTGLLSGGIQSCKATKKNIWLQLGLIIDLLLYSFSRKYNKKRKEKAIKYRYFWVTIEAEANCDIEYF